MDHCPASPVHLEMPAKRRQAAVAATATAAAATDADTSGLPNFDACNSSSYLVGPISPLFDPQRVLIRRLYFIDSDKTRYVSVGVYPGRGYDALVELGAPKLRPIVLTEPHVRTLVEHLPAMWTEMCNDKQYRCENGDFKLYTTAGYRSARLRLSDNYIIFKLHDLQILLRLLYVIHAQQIRYLEALPDILNYTTVALTSPEFVDPPASKYIPYHQLFEELKAIF